MKLQIQIHELLHQRLLFRDREYFLGVDLQEKLTRFRFEFFKTP
jgi:hypothetical protein